LRSYALVNPFFFFKIEFPTLFPTEKPSLTGHLNEKELGSSYTIGYPEIKNWSAILVATNPIIITPIRVATNNRYGDNQGYVPWNNRAAAGQALV